ncbi:hypothetical protein [Proteiniborus sp. MB09-C3]|nr:hypothetical protein [Proteiniborus sp. MB09-C3]WIV13305.1 hypothetical protein QO263_06230 [Proteiniborus sp. MB09-C3]
MKNLTLVGINLDRLPLIIAANILNQGGSMSKIKYYVNQKQVNRLGKS